jgi:hypothetical protein
MGETGYFENLLRKYEASGNVVEAQKVTPYTYATGSRAVPTGTGPAPAAPGTPPAPGAAPAATAGAEGFPAATEAKTDVTDATAIYNQMVQAGQADIDAAKAKGVEVSIGTPPPQVLSDAPRTDGRGQWQPGGTPMIDPYAKEAAPTGPTGPAPDLDISNVVLDLPDYQPPKESASARKGAAEEAYQRGRGDMGEQVHNAIISAKSMQNPQARAQFVGQVLRGMGAGLAGLSAAAGKEGRQVAAQKRGEQLRIYEAKHKVESAETLAQYNAELDQAMAQWTADMATWSSGGELGRKQIRRSTSADDKSGRNNKTRGM